MQCPPPGIDDLVAVHGKVRLELYLDDLAVLLVPELLEGRRQVEAGPRVAAADLAEAEDLHHRVVLDLRRDLARNRGRPLVEAVEQFCEPVDVVIGGNGWGWDSNSHGNSPVHGRTGHTAQ